MRSSLLILIRGGRGNLAVRSFWSCALACSLEVLEVPECSRGPCRGYLLPLTELGSERSGISYGDIRSLSWDWQGILHCQGVVNKPIAQPSAQN